eukprot:m51a1_g4873 hypothetical protein (398) ;mRNA; f:370640-372647
MSTAEAPGDTVTIAEVLDSERQLVAEAREVQAENWGDEDRCTHPEGYARQPVYACVTCAKAVGRPVGVCYGCSLACHLTHDLHELFDKHAFRCDCGTLDLPRCTLAPASEAARALNEQNKYTHNWSGAYCVCDGEYKPDEDVMLQCLACEDWFHDRCLRAPGPEPPDPDDCGDCDFICPLCSSSYAPLLRPYPGLLVALPASSAAPAAPGEPDAQPPPPPPLPQPPATCPLAAGAQEPQRQQSEAPAGNLWLRKGWQSSWHPARTRCSDAAAAVQVAAPWVFECEEEDHRVKSTPVAAAAAAEAPAATEEAAAEGAAPLQRKRALPDTLFEEGQVEFDKFFKSQSHETQISLATGYQHILAEFRSMIQSVQQSGRDVVSLQDAEALKERLMTKRRRM